VHTPILAAYLGSDAAAARSLARMAVSLKQVDVLDYRSLRPGDGAGIVIVDCRSPEYDKRKLLEKLSPQFVQLALVSESSLYRSAIFGNGYFDYLLWPLIEQEVVSRLAGCLAQIDRNSAGLYFTNDPLVQKSCDLLVRRVNQQTSLSELARMVGTNRTTLVDRFEAVFDCGPMTWLRQYRMGEAAKRLRAGHESVATIAESLGYENSNNFSTAFKAIHGHSPLGYRKMVLRKEKPV